MAMQSDAFVENGVPIPFADAVTSGLSVGVPGTPRTWATALDQWGSIDLRQALRGATEVARRGFVVDQTFVDQTTANVAPVRRLPVLGGPVPAPAARRPPSGRSSATATWPTPTTCSPAGASTRSTPAASPGTSSGTVQDPPVGRHSPLVVRPGLLELSDLASYQAPLRGPTHVSYRGLDVYGMAPPSSGGSTVGEALNILETVRPRTARRRPRRCTTTSRRAPWRSPTATGTSATPTFVDVPLERAAVRRVRRRARLPHRPDGGADQAGRARGPGRRLRRVRRRRPLRHRGPDGQSTTHLTTADRWGNVVAYTLTIESTGGNGIVVPGRGFLLNNELTDFNFTDTQGGNDPNLPGPGKRPRSSMSPTIVLADGAAVPGAGLPGRVDDHHDRAADPREPAGPRHGPAGGRRGAACDPAQHRRGPGRARLRPDGAAGARAHLRRQPGDRGGHRRSSSSTTARCWRSPNRPTRWRQRGGRAGQLTPPAHPSAMQES